MTGDFRAGMFSDLLFKTAILQATAKEQPANSATSSFYGRQPEEVPMLQVFISLPELTSQKVSMKVLMRAASEI